DGVSAAFASELRMPARHGDIVQEDVAVRVTTRRDDILIEQKSAPSIRSALDDEQRRAGRQGVDGPLVRFRRELRRVRVGGAAGGAQCARYVRPGRGGG